MTWFMKSGLYSQEKGAVYDGIHPDPHPSVTHKVWTYNQGAFVYALLLMFDATNKPEWLGHAINVVNYTLKYCVTSNGYLSERSSYLNTD